MCLKVCPIKDINEQLPSTLDCYTTSDVPSCTTSDINIYETYAMVSVCVPIDDSIYSTISTYITISDMDKHLNDLTKSWPI